MWLVGVFSHSAISVCTENHGLPTRELLETANSVRLRLAGSSSVTAVYTHSHSQVGEATPSQRPMKLYFWEEVWLLLWLNIEKRIEVASLP